MICVLGYIEEGGKMSKFNYSKFSKNKKDEIPDSNNEEGVNTDLEIEEKIEEEQPEVLNEENTNSEIEEPKTMFGIVKCKKLNVRKEPNVDSEVIEIIKEGTKIEIYGEDDDFYIVNNIHNGDELIKQLPDNAYCMKEFIEITNND